MSLSEEDKKRIEEEEYRKHVQKQFATKLKVDADIKSDQRIRLRT